MTPDVQAKAVRDGSVPQDYPGPVAEDWPDLLDIVRRLVKPQRDKENREARRKRWWRFGDRQPGLYAAIDGLSRVLALSRVSPHLAIARLPPGMVCAESMVVFAFPSHAPLAILQSRTHEIWARFFSSSMKDDLRYSPSDCVAPFPLPPAFTAPTLESAGRAYHDHRAALMVARNEGLTKTYNRFHDPRETADDIVTLRELHAEMDHAVLRAYGWDDLIARAVPEFLDENNEDDYTYQGRYFWLADVRDEVLARLLALNTERHEEEMRLGIAPTKGRRGQGEEDEDEEEG